MAADRRHRERRASIAWVALQVAIAAGLWIAATLPWGMRLYELLPFVGPGAVLGIAAVWAAYAAAPERFRWHAATRGAIRGAVGLPPLLAFLVALFQMGGSRPLLVLFVAGAWLMVGAGALAVLGDVLRQAHHAHRRHRGLTPSAARRRRRAPAAPPASR